MVSLTPTRGLAAVALLGSLSLTACDSGEPDADDPGEQELISEVTLSLAPDDGGATQTIQVTFDEDGTDPTFSPSTLTLRPGVTYDGSVELQDTFNDEDITEEIRDEAEEHLIRYAFASLGAGQIVATDTESDYTSADENGGDFAVGLTFRASVSSTAATATLGQGTFLNMTLYHFDDGPKTSSTATSDEIDVEVAFPVAFEAAPTAR